MCIVQRPHGHNCTGHHNASLDGHNSKANITFTHKTVDHGVLTGNYIPDNPPSRNKTIAAISIAAAAFSLVAIFTISFVCVKRRRTLTKTSAKGKGKATEIDRLAVRVQGDCELARPVFTMGEIRG
ncbi:hypothetical protein HBH51_113280 [Parastagonospora nodorum]|nr:hypothetical protein HBH51_113280 [Parastagonospora nodorum]